MAEDIFDVVDDQDRVVRQERRSVVHAQGLLHRAVHILVFNAAGQVFLQQRSSLKDQFPLRWDSSSSGHVDAGEDYDTAAVREIAEELGVPSPAVSLQPAPGPGAIDPQSGTVPQVAAAEAAAIEQSDGAGGGFPITLPPADEEMIAYPFAAALHPLQRLFYLTACPQTGNEFVWVYRWQFEGPFSLCPREIMGGGFYSPQAVEEWLAASPEDFAPAFAYLWPRVLSSQQNTPL
ncbi:MAG: NUDIX domain-containing protein [Candidatus Methylacidiphilales bacterium]|nr:NUDIX domain-containing protein [Candidatus Methylacidiphilales bacterium]